MVAIGAARGLSFFHDVGNKVTSKNFKSSNILLDKVGSFDLVILSYCIDF